MRTLPPGLMTSHILILFPQVYRVEKLVLHHLIFLQIQYEY